MTYRFLVLLAMASPAMAQGRPDCSETWFPKHLPAVHELVDSTGVIESLQTSSGVDDSAAFTLIFGESDSLPVVVTYAGAPPGMGWSGIRQSVWPQKSTRMWAVRLRVVRGASPSVTLERAVYCPPYPVSSLDNRRTVMVQVDEGEGLTDRQGKTVKVGVEVVVGEDGTVVSDRVGQSSGVADYDRQMLAIWHDMHFAPAMIDKQRVTGVYWTDRPSPRP